MLEETIKKVTESNPQKNIKNLADNVRGNVTVTEKSRENVQSVRESFLSFLFPFDGIFQQK